MRKSSSRAQGQKCQNPGILTLPRTGGNNSSPVAASQCDYRRERTPEPFAFVSEASIALSRLAASASCSAIVARESDMAVMVGMLSSRLTTASWICVMLPLNPWWCAWHHITIGFDDKARKELDALDKAVAERVSHRGDG